MENAFPTSLVLGTLLLGCAVFSALASDPDALYDYILPSGKFPANASADLFTLKANRAALVTGKLIIEKVTVSELPVLDGAGVSMATLTFPPNGVNPPHYHPRGSELLQVITGGLSVTLVDAEGNSFHQQLTPGDVFVFPRALVHSQKNLDPKYPARAIAAFSSANAGTVSLPPTLFGSGFDCEVLQQSFNVSSKIIDTLKDAVTSDPK